MRNNPTIYMPSQYKMNPSSIGNGDGVIPATLSAGQVAEDGNESNTTAAIPLVATERRSANRVRALVTTRPCRPQLCN